MLKRSDVLPNRRYVLSLIQIVSSCQPDPPNGTVALMRFETVLVLSIPGGTGIRGIDYRKGWSTAG